MKYVRTKDDKVYRVSDNLSEESIRLAMGDLCLKVGNTLEEVCDKFVLAGIGIIFINKEYTQYRFEGDDEWFDITETELKRGIYGAIWTAKGLIYVEIMKGILPNGEVEWVDVNYGM